MYVLMNGLGGCSSCQPRRGLGSIDLSTLTWEDYLLFGIVGMFVVGMVKPGVFQPSTRKRKSVSAKTGFAGGLVTALVVAGGGYLAYQYLVSQQTPISIPPG